MGIDYDKPEVKRYYRACELKNAAARRVQQAKDALYKAECEWNRAADELAAATRALTSEEADALLEF